MHRKKALILGLLTVGAVLVSALPAWVMWSGRIAAAVAVTWSPESPACEGTSVRKRGSQRPIIEAKKTMRCVITVEVTNRSGRTVHADRAVAGVVGPRTGSVVIAENAAPVAKGGEFDIDALVPLGRDLPAGESTAFDIVLVFHPHGCNDGGTLWWSNWPTVTIDALGRSHDVLGDKDFAFHRGGATPGCRRSTS